MSVRPHPTHPGWWVVDVGRGKDRKRLVVKQGGFLLATEIDQSYKQKRSPAKVSSPAPTIKDLVLPFLKVYKQDVTARTLEDIESTINLYLVPMFGLLRPSLLTVEHFHTFKEELLSQGLSKNTINKHLAYISKLLKWAHTAGHCQKLPFSIPRFPRKQTVPQKTREPLSREDRDSILKHIQPHYRLAYLLMADMGLRRNEALHLKVEDVDTRYKAVNVLGKGNKPRRVPFMTDRVEVAILSAARERKAGHLIINPAEGKPYLTIRKELLRAARAAEVSAEVTHHVLRYTFATLCAEDGMNPYALQKIMGHSSIETTMKIYTKVNRDFVSDEVLKIRGKPTPVDTVSKLRIVKC